MRLSAASCLMFLAAPGLWAAAAAPADAPVTFAKTIQPVLQQYCYDCHGNGRHKGDVALDDFKTAADVELGKKTWEVVLEKIRKHEMPPDDAKKQPSLAERDLVGDWIEHTLYKYDPANPDPGRVTLRRLNRAEYNNTIRDLIGVDFHPADDFPPDDSGYGFDNIGDVLSLPPMLFEKYLAAADKILDQAIATEPVPYRLKHLPSRLAEIGFNAIGVHEDGWAELISLEEDDVAVDVPIPAPGDYLVRFRAYAEPTGGNMVGGGNNARVQNAGPPAPQQVSIRVDDTVIQRFAVTLDKDAVRAAEPGKPGDPGVYEARIGLAQGTQHVRMAVDRLRGGANELAILNGRVGVQQPGKVFVKWIEIEGPLPGATYRTLGSKLTAPGESEVLPADVRELTKNGAASVKFTVPKEGEYILRAYAYATQAGPETTKMDLRIDDKSLQTFEVLAPSWRQLFNGEKIFSGHASALSLLRPFPERYEIRAKLTPGEKTFSAAFINDFADPNNENPNLVKRNLFIQSLEVVDLAQPARLPPMPETIKKYFPKTPTAQNKPACARDIIAQFAFRAWRRPAAPAELDKLAALFDLSQKQGDSFEASVKLAMKAVLVSPHFLFRGEAPLPANLVAAMDKPEIAKASARPSPTGFTQGVKVLLSLPEVISRPPPAAAPAPKPAVAKAPSLGVPVDEFSLAARLSYFLWSSTPDDALLNLAKQNQLRTHLAAEVRRMLASPKSRALVDNFAGQWLQFRSLETFEPDQALFPNFNPFLRTDMRKETEHFFEYIMREDRSVMDFLTADYTFANQNLANYYGLTGATGSDFQKVSLAGTPRRGVLTQGSVLVLTSNPTRTSPVKRGKWVLDNLLGTPPPPPPQMFVLDDEHQLTGTLRQQMEQHRANPTCASCHARMDPIGFGLENFDATGVWRDQDGNAPVDASGQLASGETFKTAVELVNILADKRRGEFLHCLAEKMFTYSLGRGLEYYDRAATDQIVANLEKNGDKFSALILGVVNSLPFQQMRRADAEPESAPATPMKPARLPEKIADATTPVP